MDILESKLIPGLKLIKPEVFYDFRGEYVETYNVNKYKFKDKEGVDVTFQEDDLSISRYGVMRGLHGDDRTWKLVQCIQGTFYLVVVDNRQDSPSYLKWESFTLSDKNRYQILIPAGCANGHLCLSETCVFSYKQSCSYQGVSRQFTIRWNDPALAIHWPLSDPIVSKRDKDCDLLVL